MTQKSRGEKKFAAAFLKKSGLSDTDYAIMEPEPDTIDAPGNLV